jgi:signal transduction histidine kinase
MRGWLAAPLVARDGTNLGLLQLSDKYAGEFTEEDLSILVQLARMASIAIENARLVERVEAALEDAEAARRLAESANQAKSDFLTIMSHELRTPLNAIGGYVQLLELGVRGPMTEAQLTDLARIRRNQEHLLGLINNVLNFAKLDAGRVHFHIVDARVDEVCADFEAMIAPQIRAKRLCYTLHHPDPTLVMRADPEKVRQIVLNLLTNAIKFTPTGGRIDLACEGSGDSVCIRITDTGTGIPADRLETIFDPFVQVHTRLTRTTEGVGLGLAISRELARSMEGDLTVTSELGAGSTFTLRVPRRTADGHHAWDLGCPA